MKADYEFLKLILTNLEENEGHLYENRELAKSVSIDLNNEQQYDRFVGHIRLLRDNGCIDCKNDDSGFSKTYSSSTYYATNYRLTSRGYEFLDMLRNETVFNKIKTLSISTAFTIGKEMLIESVLYDLKFSINCSCFYFL